MKELTNIIKKFHPEFFINFLDIGAQGGIPSEWVQARSIIKTIGFEPVHDKYKNLQNKFPSDKWFNTALWNSSGQVNFFITPNSDYSSILEPNVDVFEDFGKGKAVKKFKTTKLDTNYADELIDKCDFMKLDVQGGELEVLKGAENLLKDVKGICTEVSFVELYKNQALFGDVDTFLRKKGFKFISFYGAMIWSTKEARNQKGRIARLLQSNAIYIKDSNLERDNLIALIIEAAYGLPDLSIKRLKYIPNPLREELHNVLKRLIKNTSATKIPGRHRIAKTMWNILSKIDERPFLNSNFLWFNSIFRK